VHFHGKNDIFTQNEISNSWALCMTAVFHRLQLPFNSLLCFFA
jgi:hypothetical protein